MIDFIIDKLINIYIKHEQKKNTKKKQILPNYVLKRRIQIYNNNQIVFDSNDVDEIPESIQYTIKSYGIPADLKCNSKTPLIYRTNTTLSSMFPSIEDERQCMESLNKIN